jgi:drug/metabolite transporter (DMT)-like permease
MHAGWNAVLKIRLEPFLAMTLINATGGVLALPLLIYTGFPAAASWGWAALSLLLHLGYYLALSEAYRRADMSVVYPVARGSAPLITTVTATTLLGETLKQSSLLGILTLAMGILLMTWQPKKAEKADPLGLAFAGLTALIISGYTISDGSGARASGDPLAYSALLFVLNGIVPVCVALIWRGRDGLAPLRQFIGPGFAGGAMSMASYTIAIWAMSIAPIPLVAAVRETSVLFGMAIAVLILREPLRWNRLAAAALMVAGLVLIRL